MKAIKVLIAVMSLAASVSQAQTYGIHLYFNETEFVDTISIKEVKPGVYEGSMHVPNDFDGTLENIEIKGQEISFDAFVPKNSARPQDLVFHYKGNFFDASRAQLIGYVTLKGTQDFVASFVGFLRN